ncbi:putative phage abortive infection protein [uncultured Aliivibrio sp.]|uniref:putative phage abortive infection protein n=1 Tax=uncultured Aliivibrio sp. TaxID=873085 RepID=UPI00262B1951|nr:putative phage abortive infection protein [uncultured Aliivibrio sp.]
MLKLISKDSVIFSLILVGSVGTFCGVIFFVWNEPLFIMSSKINAEKIAQFGDFIGGFFGSIWALAGVFLFYKALTEQRRDFANNREALDLQVTALNQQIEEFRLSRDEQVLNRKVYEEQSRTLKLQQFESNFYSLLNVYINIKNQFNINNGEFFKSLLGKIKESYSPENNYRNQHSLFVDKYLEIHDFDREKLSNYFRSLYRIIKIIDTSNFLKNEQKQFYAKIIRAQISDYELILISFNAHSYWGDKLKKYILSYNLLKHIPIFCKPEFSYFSLLQTNNKLLLFTEELDKFLVKHVSKYYSFELDYDKIEEKFINFGVIVGIYYDDSLRFSIYCEYDLKDNGIFLSDEQFASFLEQYFFEKTVVQTYIDKERVEIEASQKINNNTKEFSIVINSEEEIRLNQDER